MAVFKRKTFLRNSLEFCFHGPPFVSGVYVNLMSVMNFAELQQTLAEERTLLAVHMSERAAARESEEEFDRLKVEAFRHAEALYDKTIPELRRLLLESEGCAAHCDDEKRDLRIVIDSKSAFIAENDVYCAELEDKIKLGGEKMERLTRQIGENTLQCQKHEQLGQHDLADQYRSAVTRLSMAFENVENTRTIDTRNLENCKVEVQRARAENLESKNEYDELVSERAVCMRDIRSYRRKIRDAKIDFDDHKDDETRYAAQQLIHASRAEQLDARIGLLEESIARFENQLRNQ